MLQKQIQEQREKDKDRDSKDSRTEKQVALDSLFEAKLVLKQAIKNQNVKVRRAFTSVLKTIKHTCVRG